MRSRSAAGYPSRSASGRPVSKWNSRSGSSATSSYMCLTRCSSSEVFSWLATVLIVSAPSRRDGMLAPVCQPPLRPALLEAPCLPAGGLQAAHGLVRVGAERAAAVRDDLAVGRQLGQAILELVDRDRARALDVPGLELLRRADVD